MDLLRYRFIVKDGSSFVVDILNSKNGKFNIFEVYEIQRIPKVSGKGLINYYCEIQCQNISKDFVSYFVKVRKNTSTIKQRI